MKVKFYKTSSGRSLVEEFLHLLPENIKFEVADALILLEQGKILSMPLSRNLSSIKLGLNELRFRDKAGLLRVIYFIQRTDSIYLIYAFRKKMQKIPSNELDILLKCIKEI